MEYFKLIVIALGVIVSSLVSSAQAEKKSQALIFNDAEVTVIYVK